MVNWRNSLLRPPVGTQVSSALGQINVIHFWKFLGLGLTWTLHNFLSGSVRENWWWRQKTFIIYFCGWCHYYWIRHAGTYRDMGNFPDNPIPTKEGRLCPPSWFVPTMFRELPTRLWIARKRGSWVSSGDQDDGKFECVIVIYSNAKHRSEFKLTGRKNLGRTILQIDSESL